MSKPAGLQSKIFLDGGDPIETKEIATLLGFLDGQTTNPSLVAKNPLFIACKESGTCSDEELWNVYKTIIAEIDPYVSDSVSIEVYADANTKAEEMIAKGLILNTWSTKAHVKLPITKEGLIAAKELVSRGIRVNMTLCFTQSQAAAVYGATAGAKEGDVFLSPFVGRLDDRGEDGMSFIKNVITMFNGSDRHVSPLVASVRSMDHFMYSIALGASIITAPAKILREWGELGMPLPDAEYSYKVDGLTVLPYETIDLSQPWESFDLTHPLTDSGIVRFASDWNNLLT